MLHFSSVHVVQQKMESWLVPLEGLTETNQTMSEHELRLSRHMSLSRQSYQVRYVDVWTRLKHRFYRKMTRCILLRHIGTLHVVVESETDARTHAVV